MFLVHLAETQSQNFYKKHELVFMFKSLQVGYQLIHKEIVLWVEAQVVKKEDS